MVHQEIQVDDAGNVYVTGYSYGSGTMADYATIKYSQEIVPVELISFSGVSQSARVLLSWQTASELNNFGFEIERNANEEGLPAGQAGWRIIGFKKGQGTTTETHSYSFTDEAPFAGRNYYRLKQIDFDGTFSYSEVIEVELPPMAFELYQNYPNPFNPTTKIKFTIPSRTEYYSVPQIVTLKVYDVLGNEVATLVNEEKAAGSYEVEFNAARLSSGIYFYKLQAENFVETKKMLLVK
ncbi:MAG TPA: T9SS type A sorting domain-containing protein [Ignavibacteriaceae bacterium]|nr:T9SS type A sorting domain-containing protein [Ignavibacteriaceae bacterium]